MKFWPVLLAVAGLVAQSRLASAQPKPAAGDKAVPTAAASDTAARSQAYFEFLRGRLLEADGDPDAAADAYRAAAKLDPASAEIQAELAGLYARQNNAEQAIAAADGALRVDPENAEAHWVLGTVYAALAQGDDDLPGDAIESLDKAIAHLEKARPARPYDLGLALALGRLYLRKEDYDKSLAQLKIVADAEPGAAEVWFLMAQAYDGAGKRADAIDLLRHVLELEPRYFRALVTLADMLDKERRFVESADMYAQAVAQSPRSVELRLRQATALLNAGRPTEARQLLRKVSDDAPTDGGVLYLLTEAQRQLKEYDDAEATAKRLIAIEPSQIRGSYALAMVYEGRREHRQVIETLAPVVNRTGQSGSMTPLLVHLATVYQEVGEFDHAIATFERARSSGGGDPLFDLYLAQAYLAANRPADALNRLVPLRASRPEDYRVARLQADALAKSGKLDDAVALLRTEADRSATRIEPQLGLAALCVEHERYDCAQTALDRAERDFPKEVQIAFQRGALYEKQKRYPDAEKAFREALARDPLHAPSLNYLGYMLAERNERLDEAVSLLQRALESDPWNASYLDSLGVGWYFVRGDLDQAGKYLSMAADRLPLNSVVQDHLGDLLMKQGRRDQAIAAWEQALKGDRESIVPDEISRKIDDAKRAQP